ncbi:serine protease [Couchioplanes caeruleus]|uniref:S1 family peptidase n=1 Tax=Couchioplanes caeruleus TaxID=56438 RepID=UPI0020BF1287|nr:serine protease [Couchioplanes caeruleus]UQU68188.1 serine protease [Couchioplanes caeruleus]
MNAEQLRRTIVRVARADGNGTGFLIGPDLVLTCHHVVRGAERVTLNAGPVTVAVEQVITPPPGGEGADLAVLRARLPSLPAAELSAEAPEPGDEVSTFGFTDDYPAGDSAHFVYEGPSYRDDETLYRLRSAQARPGLSGAPLLHARSGKVVGLVSRSRDKGTDLGARAVPVEVAARLFPALVPLAAPGPAPREDEVHLRRLIAIHENSARLLEEQVAAYGMLNVPPYKRAELEHERAEIERLRALLGRR